MRLLYIPAVLIVTIACSHTVSQKENKSNYRIDSIIQNLYHLVSTDETDSLSRLYDTLNYKIALRKGTVLSDAVNNTLDSLSTINSELRNYLEACNSFESEIYLVEQNIKTLNERYQANEISSDIYSEKLNNEKMNLKDIENRVDDKRQEIRLILKRCVPLMNKLEMAE